MRVSRVNPLVYALVAASLLAGQAAYAQQSAKRPNVPSQFRYTGALPEVNDSRVVAVLFSLYGQQTGGVPLWQETQNVVVESGRYSVLLGAIKGLPATAFTANEARWLGVQVLADAKPEQPRVMLVSVPYALKAQDADTLGGLPASAYVRADSVSPTLATGGQRVNKTSQAAALETEGTVSADPHTTNAIPKFTSGTDTLADSMLLEKYTQPAFNAFGQSLGINEDVLQLGNGTGLSKRLDINGRMSAKGFDIVTSDFSSIHVVNNNSDGVAMELNARDQGPGFTNGLFASAESANGTGGAFIALEPSSPQISGDYAYGIFAQNRNAQGVGLFGWSSYNGAGGDSFPTLTGPIGVWASTAHSTGIPAVFDQRASGGGKVMSIRSQGSEVASIASSGNITTSGNVTANTVTATTFVGDGSGLTGVSGTFSDPAACPANQFVTDLDGTGALTCAQPSSSNLSDGASLATKTYADAGDAALAAPQYVTLAASSTLTNERVLTAGVGIDIADGGAGNAVTIGQKMAFVQTSVQSGDTISNFPSGGSEFATSYTIPANTLQTGMVIEVWASGHLSSSLNGNTFAFGVKLNSTVVIPGDDSAFVNATTLNWPWVFEGRIICTSVSGSTATLEAQGFVVIQNAAGSSGAARPAKVTVGTLSVDPTQTQQLKIFQTSGPSNDVGDTATMRQLLVKILK